MADPVSVLVGTTKGAFVISSNDRETWSLRGPMCDGWPINHVIGDGATGRLWAAGGGDFAGAGIWRSENFGEDWTLAKLANGEMDKWIDDNPEEAAKYGLSASGPAPYSGEIDAVWSLARVGERLYAGVKPATLYDSTDGGATWTRVDGLTDHPSRETWQPGAAGMTLHTIVSDPADPSKLWVAISAAGVFATEDGGKMWEQRIRRANAPSEAGASSSEEDPFDPSTNTVGICVHNMVRAPAGNGQDVLYQQNHHGVFRSPDGGRSWVEISDGLPSRFGFPVAVHPYDPETIWTVPLNGDSAGRYPPDASAAVWRSRDGGGSWTPMRDGLPQRDCFFTVLRQAMAVDRNTPAGVYFGTNTGSIFASTDEGDNWSEIARHLPTILSVEMVQRAR